MFPRILVVEDDRPIRALLARASRRVGLEVDEACDGAEAVELMASRSYGLLLIDLMMPRMDGFALIDEIARMGLDHRPIVIVMTAFPDASVHQLDPHVVHAFLRKPFDLEMVIGMIQDVARELDGVVVDAPAVELRTPAS